MTAELYIHPTAEVASGALIGPGTKIWQHSIVLDGAVIGAGVKLAHNVFVEGNAWIGNGVTVKDNVTIYEGVTLEDDVFVGPNAVFTNVINPRAFIERKAEIKPTLVRRGATIGANATMVLGVTVGRYAMVGAGAVVTRDVSDHALVVGNPARRVGWVSRAGYRLSEDLRCPVSGIRYVEGRAGLTEAS